MSWTLSSLDENENSTQKIVILRFEINSPRLKEIISNSKEIELFNSIFQLETKLLHLEWKKQKKW